ncbi:MAG: AAA family ATPase [Candidatus Limnocylindria bacterium]
MRIERIELDGFGRFHDASWALEPGLTVVHGANEAGKTTFLNALRALLFGFDATREGRTWYPAFAGGRRGGRLVLATGAGERWVIERHGERGGGGALTVRAPNGNQGGQETLDRLLHGADKDLFGNVFAFGLGELQDLHSLSTNGVRGRIYGAGAGLGGASAVDVERSLRAGLRETFVPTGSKPPLNALLTRIESLRTEITSLAGEPEEYEAAHRECSALEARIAAHRAAARSLRERIARLANLRAAAPVLAELAEIDRELGTGDATLDEVSHEVAATLDRRVGELDAARTAQSNVEEELTAARRERDAIRVDAELLEAAVEISSLRDAIAAAAGSGARRADLEAGFARNVAIVNDQLARVGAWDEARLLALDDSIPAVQATRDADERLAASRADAAAADGHWQAARNELESREHEVVRHEADPDLDARRLAVRDLLLSRSATSGSTAAGPGHDERGVVVVAAALGVVIGLVGLALGQGPIGAALGVAIGVAAFVVGTGLRRRGSSGDTSRDASRSELLARAGLADDASDADLAALAEALAAAHARADLARDQSASLERRRADLERFVRTREAAEDRRRREEASWAAWLRERRMPDELAPAAAREMLAAAGVARGAAAERDRLHARLVALDDEDAALSSRADDLLARLGAPVLGEAPSRAASVATLAQRAERARDDDRRATALDVAIDRLAERHRTAAEIVARREADLHELLGVHHAASPDALRSRVADADARSALRTRARELRSALGGIAGGPEAVADLTAEANATDAAAIVAELSDSEAELERMETEQAEAHAGIGVLSARIQQLEAAEEIGALRQELAIAEGSAAAMARDWAVRAVTLRLLEETRQRYERERQPDVVRAAEAHFARITGDRYTRIVAPPGDVSVRVETPGGEARVTDELSRGTAEQLYLALRFGLIEEFARHAEPLPVVMDDILVNFDPERAGRASAAIRELATRHQVLYFTCHAWTADALDPEGHRTLALA